MPKTKAIIKFQNVVAIATLNQKVDLNAVVKGYPEAEYRPEKFPGLVFRLNRPKTGTLIFASGKMVCTGAKSGMESRSAIMNVVKELKKCGIIILNKPRVEVVNIVASAATGTINLEVDTASIWYYTSNASANHTLNIPKTTATTSSHDVSRILE